MTADTFRQILKRAPFQPFRVVMSSGEAYQVMHPEMALVSGRALGTRVTGHGVPEGDRLVFCSYLHISASGELRRQAE